MNHRIFVTGAFVLMLLHLFSSAGEAQVWSSVGPAPFRFGGSFFAGRVSSIAADPNDSSHWLTGFGNGGVWETRDSGVNWAPLSDSWPSLAIGAVTFAPSDSRTIYVATGEALQIGVTKTGIGIMKSINGGSTWNLLAASSFARASVRRLRVHPQNAGLVVAATSRGGYGRDAAEGVPGSPPFGILRPTDGGSNWVRTLAGQASALEVDPTNSNNQYAAISEIRRNGINNDSAGSVLNGVYRSTDSGQTWALISGPWGVSTPSTDATGRIELAISPSNPNVLYASIAVAPNGGSSAQPLLGLYRTDNAWAPAPTWIQISISATGNAGYCGPEKCNYSHVISVDPADPNTLFAGGAEVGLFRCSSCGPSPVWTNVTINKAQHGDHHALTWVGNRLIDGNDGGVWSTVDSGNIWLNHNRTFVTAMFYGGALHPTDPNIMLGGFRDNGTALRTSSNEWILNPLNYAPDLPEVGEAEVEISSRRPQTDWMSSWLRGVIGRTTNAGQLWTNAYSGIDVTGVAFVAPVRKCSSNDDVFVTGTNRPWRTNDFFTSTRPTWVQNGPPHTAPNPNSLSYPGTILSIAFAPSDASCNTYAYGNRGGEIRLTTDGGGNWKDVDPSKNLPTRPLNSLAFDPANANILYAAFSSFDVATPTKPGHVFKTTNAMSASPSWVNISPPDDIPYNVIFVHPKNSNSVYAGTDTGLWYSANGGSGWQRHGPNAGLPNAPVYDLKINPTTNQTVAFTYGRGGFSLDGTALPPSGPLLSITSASSLFTAPSGNVYSQKLIATGGIAPYTWTLSAGTLPMGLTLSSTGVLSGIPTSTGVYTFTFVVTDGAGAVASQTFSLTVISPGGMTRAGALAHIAAGGGWTTVITLNNTSTFSATATVVLHAEDGSILNLPGTTTQRGVGQSGTAATFTGIIDPNGTLLVSLQDQVSPTAVGWAEVLSTRPVAGFAIFRFADSDGRTSEGTVPLQTTFPTKLIAPYDNTTGFATGLAIANLSNLPVNISATISDQDGSPLGIQSIAVPASGHISFYFPERLVATAGKQGIVTLQTSQSAGITAVGLRFSPFGTFTSVPTTPAQSVAASGTAVRSGVLSQIAAGGGWTTTISLNNTSASPVTVTVVLHSESGGALAVPVTLTQQGATQTSTTASLTSTINPNATLVISMPDQSSATSVGWADVLGTGPIGGVAIFRFTDPNGRVSEGTAPVETQFPSRLIAPYDNTTGFATGVAIANLSNSAVTVNATVSDQNGSSLDVQSIVIPASGHTSFYFPERLIATTARQGIVTFQTNGSGGLTAVGLRFSPFGTFTSVPTFSP